MSSVKVVLRKKIRKDGTYPLAIRITKDRTSSFVFIGQSIHEDDWDEAKQRVRKSHPNSARLNNFILSKLAEANDKLLELQTQNDTITPKAVRTGLKPNTNGSSFFCSAESYLENFKTAGKYNRLNPDQSRLKQFKEFLGDKDISFQEINVPLLNKFKAWLKGKKGASDRSIVNNLIIIRTIYNLAIKANVADPKHYPFGKEKIQIKLPESIKIGLTMAEVNAIENLDLQNKPILNHCRNLWLFSFYFAGMRISDVLRLRWSDFQDDRLTYKMGKNAKTGSLKSSEKALAILKQYTSSQRSKDDLVFPELKSLKNLDNAYLVQRKISHAVKRIDKNLKVIAELSKIEKKLTMHIARHTFGNISGDKISIQMLQKLYRHSSITTTIGYQSNFIHKDADEALEAVLNS